MLQRGVELQRQGLAREAEAYYRRALELQPDNGEAFRLLGLSAYQNGDPAAAVERLSRAIGVNESNPQYHYELGVVLHEQGRVQEAVAAYRAATRLDPRRQAFAEALATALGEAASGVSAEELAQLLMAHPESAALCRLYTEVLRGERGLAGAAAEYQRLVEMWPGSHALRHALGLILLERGDPESAVEQLRLAAATAPGEPRLRNDLGLALWRNGDREGAESEFSAAIQLDAELLEPYNNLGALYQEKGDLKKAISYFQSAIRADPMDGTAAENLGRLFVLTGHVESAQEYFKQAARCGRELSVRSKIDGLELRRVLQLPAIYQCTEEIETVRRALRTRLDELAHDRVLEIRDPANEVGITNFFLAYHGYGDADIQRQIGQIYRKAWRIDQPRLKRGPGSRIRVGFVSANLYNHTIGKLNRGTIANMDREKFSVHVFQIGERNDRTTRMLRDVSDEYRSLPKSLDVVRDSIVDAGLDILLFTDIGMEPFSYFLAFYRMAPVQCVTWGHPITTGIDTIDYFISSEDTEVAGNEWHYTEKLIRLKTMQPYYSWPTLSGPAKPRAAFGLPPDRTLYICPQSLFKFHPDFDPLVAEILRRDERGVLLLIQGHDSGWAQVLMSRFRNAAPDVVDRIRIIPRGSANDFMNWIAVSDVMLDTPVFCGGNTTYEGLAMGTPVVTLPSELLRGRLTHGIYEKMGYRECVARSPAQYVDTAVRLGCERDYHHAVSGAIRERNGVLYEDLKPVRELETFFETVVEEQIGRG